VGRGAGPEVRAGTTGVARKTERLYLEPGHGFEAQARVVAVDERGLAFDRTCFYPGGGGQPSDDGTAKIGDGEILEIVSAHTDAADVVWHVTRSLVSPALIGRDATLAVNRARRLALTRHPGPAAPQTQLQNPGWGVDAGFLQSAFVSLRERFAPKFAGFSNDVNAHCSAGTRKRLQHACSSRAHRA